MNKKVSAIIVASAIAICTVIFIIVFAHLSKSNTDIEVDTTVRSTEADTISGTEEQTAPEVTTDKTSDVTSTDKADHNTEVTSADQVAPEHTQNKAPTATQTTSGTDTTENKEETTKSSHSKPSTTKAEVTTRAPQTTPAETTAKKPSVTTKPADTTRPTETNPVVTNPVNPDRTEPWMGNFTAYDQNGNIVNLTDYLGKPIILNFWATWCAPCKKEMPDFYEKFLEYGDEIQFLMVNVTGYDTVKDVQTYLNETGYTFPIIYDVDLDAVDACKVNAYPTTFFIDAEGYIIAKAVGTLSADNLQKNIDKIR